MILTYPEHLSTIMQTELYFDPSFRIVDDRDRKSIMMCLNCLVGIGSSLAKPYDACVRNIVC